MPLCRLLELQGASTLRLPALEIKPVGNRRETAARLGALENFDVIIFTSANAVRFGASLLDQKRGLTLAAMGPATARALNHAGYRVAVQPPQTFDSESLLRHPKLERPAGSRILIIKGGNGRPFLEQELARRGAQVATADVYRRVPATPESRGARGSARPFHRGSGAGDHLDQPGNCRQPARHGRSRVTRAIRTRALAGARRARGGRRTRARPVGAARAG